MILSTHAIVGGAMASLMPDQPALAFVAGIASHFVIDAIPHSDYPLRSISVSRNRPALFADRLWVRDLGLLAFDASAGLAIALLLYASPRATPAILLGAVGGMLPDPLRLIHRLYPREPFRSFHRFHAWIHTKHTLTWPWAVSSQALLIVLTICAAELVRHSVG